jgi:cytochrome b subunit of formate dehydrogenase
MNGQPKEMGHFQIRWIPKYTFVERFLHWVHTVSFIPLVGTGLVLYLSSLQPLAQGEAGIWMRLVHRLAAVLFIAEPVLYGIVQPLRLWLNIALYELHTDGTIERLWEKWFDGPMFTKVPASPFF